MMFHKILITSVLLLVAASLCAQDKADETRLYTYQMLQHKAQLVMLNEEGLIDGQLARKLAKAIIEADRETRAEVVPLREDYAAFERRLVAKAGPDASKLHMGRSNNDLGATSERLFMRDDALEILAGLAQARGSLVEIAEKHVDTIIPGYTQMVQAQPTTLAHQLSAFIHGLERDEQRIREAYQRIDASPLGVGAFTTSGFALNRNRLRELTGLTGLVENGYDAVMVATVDTKVEFAGALSLSALNVGRLIQQFLIQYGDSRPGISIADGAVGHSSIMPQKRNPSDGERIRVLCSSIVADAHAVALMAHNTPGGEHKDIRFELLERVERVSREAKLMFAKLKTFAGSWRVNPERTRELVTNDYSVMTELADTLLREGNVPFRTGHAVASSLTSYGRKLGKRPLDLSYDEFRTVYREIARTDPPIGEEQFRRAMNPEEFVRRRKGIGGPQPDEMRRQLALHRQRLAELEVWLADRRTAIRMAAENLERQFAKLQ
ncbi:MAG: argininosuccinate lyase [Bryobacterales bacterium]|nr:argininosuccinate lyase [Bryobacterales bacterium]